MSRKEDLEWNQPDVQTVTYSKDALVVIVPEGLQKRLLEVMTHFLMERKAHEPRGDQVDSDEEPSISDASVADSHERGSEVQGIATGIRHMARAINRGAGNRHQRDGAPVGDQSGTEQRTRRTGYDDSSAANAVNTIVSLVTGLVSGNTHANVKPTYSE